MKDSMQYQTSYFVDRSWQKINPNKDIYLNMSKAKEFIQLLMYEQSKINILTHANPQHGNIYNLEQKIHRFILEYVQQKQLNNSSKKQVSFIKQSSHRFELKDCLEIWRWMTEDNKFFDRTKEIHNEEDSLNMNEFQINKNYSPIALKSKVSKHNKNSKSNTLYQLSLEDQQIIMKKSLQMVYMYQHQFKIIYNHYCKFMTQKQHQKIHTFDDASQALETLTIHRYMLFCRQFDIIKTLEFKKKNQHNFSINKHILLDIFKKCAHLQKFMNFQGFLVSLVNIAIKINENFDLRSYMHIQLFLNSLKVRYYEQFMKKINELNIKYTPTEFYNCYKNILKKVITKHRKQVNPNPSLFNNPYFEQYERSTLFEKEKTAADKLQQNNLESNAQSKESMIRSSHSVPNLRKGDYKKNMQPNTVFHNDKRKVSLAVLPSLNQNKYFKPIQHNNNQNNFSQYLYKTKLNQNPLSVFKNRITGYTNINSLKTKPFHMMDNAQMLSSNLNANISDKSQTNNQKNNKQAIQLSHSQNKNYAQQIALHKQQNLQLNQNQTLQKVKANEQNSLKQSNQIQQTYVQKLLQMKNVEKKEEKQQKKLQKNQQNNNRKQQPHKFQKIESSQKQAAAVTLLSGKKVVKQISTPQKSIKKLQDNKRGKQVLKLPSLVKGNIDHKQQKEMMSNIKKKLQVKDDDQMLNQHLQIEQQKEKEVNGRLIQVFKSYNFNQE